MPPHRRSPFRRVPARPESRSQAWEYVLEAPRSNPGPANPVRQQTTRERRRQWSTPAWRGLAATANVEPHDGQVNSWRPVETVTAAAYWQRGQITGMAGLQLETSKPPLTNFGDGASQKLRLNFWSMRVRRKEVDSLGATDGEIAHPCAGR